MKYLLSNSESFEIKGRVVKSKRLRARETYYGLCNTLKNDKWSVEVRNSIVKRFTEHRKVEKNMKYWGKF